MTMTTAATPITTPLASDSIFHKPLFYVGVLVFVVGTAFVYIKSNQRPIITLSTDLKWRVKYPLPLFHPDSSGTLDGIPQKNADGSAGIDGNLGGVRGMDLKVRRSGDKVFILGYDKGGKAIIAQSNEITV